MGQKFAYPVLFLKSCKRVSIPVKYTPLLHKDVVESTACPHQKAVSTFLPPAQAPPKLPARREGFPPGHEPFRGGACLGGRASRFRVEATGPEGGI